MTHYTIDRDGFHIAGSRDKYNRVLYGGHRNDHRQERYFTFAGDTPVFLGAVTDYEKNLYSYYAKSGMLASGLALTPGYRIPYFYSDEADLTSGWFHHSDDIAATFRNGCMHYTLSQFSPWFPRTEVEIEVCPLQQDDGFLVRYSILCEQRVFFCAGFGGIGDFSGRFEYDMIKEREFHVSDAETNRVACGKNHAEIDSGFGSSMLVGTSFDAEFSPAAASALAVSVPTLMFSGEHEPGGNSGQVARIRKELSAREKFDGFIVVLRNSDAKTLAGYLADLNPAGKIRKLIRDKQSVLAVNTPDPVVDQSVKSTLLALDASWHGKTFYHGAHGYHSPFLGWRNWYAPSDIGWHDRVKTAIRSHLATMTTGDGGGERIWYDGAARPDLDHEGTQYHHLENAGGRLPALLHRDDIYTMQEVAVDMTLHFLEQTGDLEFAGEILDSLDAVLDFEERVFDYDNDGLYQNFLNTWISDGHSYNGGGCAQSSAYNYSANARMAEIALRLGRPHEKYAARAEKIRNAYREKLWLEDRGVFAEYIDTIGRKLVHPSPELSTIYLGIEAGLANPFQAYRMLRFIEGNITGVSTSNRGGRLWYSSNWLPKKYSTCGLFPSENACLALAYFRHGFREQGLRIFHGLLDAFAAGRNPGLVRHVVSDLGGSELGDLDFTDTSGAWLRLIVEGVWGIRFNLIRGTVGIMPQLPDGWDHASIRTGQIAVNFIRSGNREIYRVHAPDHCRKIFRAAMRSSEVEAVLIDGAAADYGIEAGVGHADIVVETAASDFELEIIHGAVPPPELAAAKTETFTGNRIVISADAGEIGDVNCPPGILDDIAFHGGKFFATVAAASGSHTCFLLVKHLDFAGWLPFDFDIAALPEIRRETEIDPAAAGFIDMRDCFNDSLATIYDRQYLSPRPDGYSIGMRINGRSAWEWTHTGHNSVVVDDSRLRNAADGVCRLPSGLSFITPRDGKNVACVSVWDNFPAVMSIPVGMSGKMLAVFFIGGTNCMQNGVENARLTVVYENGGEKAVPLFHPDNFDDWLLPSLLPGGDIFYFSDINHGIVNRIALDETRRVSALRVEAVANEVILGILGISIY